MVDTERLLSFRAEVNAASADAGGKVSVTDLLVRACAVALHAHPQVNASWGGDAIVRHRRIHIGVAVATDGGLLVPVIRDADRKTVREIAAEARSLAERAHTGTLTPSEFTGGTFTISNLGMYAVDHFTAIINPPEAAILAVGAASPTPVVRDGEVVVRSIIKLTLPVDHRVVDGAPAAAFLRKLKDIVQKPLADRELNAGGGPGRRSAFLLPTGGAGWCRPCPSHGGVRGILRVHRDCGRGCMAGRCIPMGR
ncbi:pyruvate dehydrogenase complex, E2 component, dihydrolipoamide acetyltransferase [Rhodococcus wratislaviensis IFP 2016]|nr:pyruvate dehydrogenase complex, E2 component, dihydrolipoamide acetyltransferase [Rhodococcus wratislaviensis IFP 2016]